MRDRDIYRFAVMVLVGLAAVALALFAVWQGMEHVPPTTARVWALAATLLLPAAGFVGYRLGHVESRGRMKGIDDGLDRVTGAAAKVVDLRGQAARTYREAARAEPPVIQLPEVRGSYELLPPTSGQVVELE